MPTRRVKQPGVSPHVGHDDAFSTDLSLTSLDVTLGSTLIDMNGIDSLVADAGGLLHKRQLVALGARDRHLTWAVRRGYVRRPRRGWYTTFATDDPRYIAVRAGGRLTGASALALLGGWQWSSRPPITVSVPKNASRFRRIRGVRVVWDSIELSGRGSNWSVSPLDALKEALLEVPFEEAVSLLDWAVGSGLVEKDDVPRLASELPRDIASIDEWVEENCESFLESVVRTRCRQGGHRVTVQSPLPNGQRIDMVVDGVVGVETDGFQFHRDSFEKDRRKDLEIVLDGRWPMRLSYGMVRDEWPRILGAIEAAVGHHRGGPTPCVGNSGAWPRPARRGRRLWRLRPPGRRPEPELPTGSSGAAGDGGATGGWTAAGDGGATGWTAAAERAAADGKASRQVAQPRPARRRGRTRLGTIFG